MRPEKLYLLDIIDTTTGPNSIISFLAFAGVLILLLCLIVLIESTVLQGLQWNGFRRSLKGALLMNLASVLVSFGLLGLVSQLRWLGVLLSWAASVLIEGWVLIRLKPGEARRNWVMAFAANLASYAILIAPAYLMAPTK